MGVVSSLRRVSVASVSTCIHDHAQSSSAFVFISHMESDEDSLSSSGTQALVSKNNFISPLLLRPNG
jgi:hypothetical protein